MDRYLNEFDPPDVVRRENLHLLLQLDALVAENQGLHDEVESLKNKLDHRAAVWASIQASLRHIDMLEADDG